MKSNLLCLHGMPQRQTTRVGRNRAFLAIALILSIDAGYAQLHATGAGAESATSIKNSGKFGAMLMLTDDPDGLFEAWDRPASPDYGPSISGVSTAQRGDMVLSFIVFAGCAADGEGNCNCSVQYTAYFPDGSIYGYHEGEAWIGKPAPPDGQLQLSVDNLGLRIEEDDPFGVYSIEAVIVDHIAKSELKLVTELTIVDSN